MNPPVNSAAWDDIVVGSGIAGLMVALRLRARGRKVLVLESDVVGSGVTVRNHGIVHSGALMARIHPKVGIDCRRSQSLFLKSFPSAFSGTRESVYFAERSRFSEFTNAWREHGFVWRDVDPAEVAGWVRPEVIERSGFVGFGEPVINCTRLMGTLAAACRESGVEIAERTAVVDVWVDGGRARGVVLGTGDRIRASSVLLANGEGVQDLLQAFHSKCSSAVRSRTVVMAAARHDGMPVSLVCLDFGGPVSVPVTSRTVLLSLYGGTQPPARRSWQRAVSAPLAAELTASVRRYLREGGVHLDDRIVWQGCKTEVRDDRSDAWGTQPGFTVLDHADADGIAGLVTVLPGKMSLAFHVSQAALRVLGYDDEALALPQDMTATVPAATDEYPWGLFHDEDVEAGLLV